MSKITSLKYTLYLFTLSLGLLYGCAGDKDTDGDGVPDKRDKCPTVAAKTRDGCPVQQEVSKVNLFMETSASMGGYFRNDAAYKTIVSDLAVKVEKAVPAMDIWFIADSAVRYKGDAGRFSSDIATTRIADQKSSELHRIIAKVAEKTGKGEIAILVSDCILSFPDAAIRANPEINRTEAPNALKNNIFSTFADLNKHGLATSIYAFKSGFYGVYYDYRNVKTRLNGESRPFYIWVIGGREVLGRFDEQLEGISSFHPEKSLHFGLSDQTVNSFSIIPQIERSGKWNKDGSGLKDVAAAKNEPAQFCTALNLGQLPPYARQTDYLQQHLQLSAKGCKAAFVVKKKEEADQSKLKSQNQKLELEAATHVLLVSVTEMDLAKATIDFTLPLQYDTWYKDWSTMDDKNIAATANRTFAFEYLIRGVTEAYDTHHKNYIDLHLNLKK